MDRTMELIIKILKKEITHINNDGSTNVLPKRHPSWNKIKAQALKDDGYLHKSEIRFPEEKKKGKGHSASCICSLCKWASTFNESTSETKKLNGVG